MGTKVEAGVAGQAPIVGGARRAADILRLEGKMRANFAVEEAGLTNQ